MQVLQRYFGPENYPRALDYLANHMWLFKNWTWDINWKQNNIQNNFKQLWSDFRKVFKWTCHLMKWIIIDHEMCSLKWTGIQNIHKWLISRSGPSYNLQSNNDYSCSAILVISMVYSTKLSIFLYQKAIPCLSIGCKSFNGGACLLFCIIYLNPPKNVCSKIWIFPELFVHQVIKLLLTSALGFK